MEVLLQVRMKQEAGTSIGNSRYSGPKFATTFEGNSHKISNLYINRTTTSYIGLFGYLGYWGSCT